DRISTSSQPQHLSFHLLLPTASSFSFFYSSGHHRHLHSFPTRRSSDLPELPRRPLRRSRGKTADAGMRRGQHRRGALVSPERLRSEEHTSELQSRSDLVCRLLLEKKKKKEHASGCALHKYCWTVVYRAM